MLRDFLSNKAIPTVDPLRENIDAAAVNVVAAEQQERKATDAFLLADSACAGIRRRMSAAGDVHTSQGTCLIDRTTGREIPDEELERANRRRDEAESAHVAAGSAASAARGRLHNAQKVLELRARNRAYWANQAEQEAALTPAEREIRARRDAAQRDRVAQ
ncbi:MAG: hypothetical protein ABIY55_11350 [Kofleriaceae bacterium]